MATTQVILTDKINNLGSEADIVTVKAGFANNYLIPQGKAFPASKQALRQMDQLKEKRAKREAAELAEANELAGKISKLNLSFTLETGQGGKAFGSVTSIDIHKQLTEKGIEIDRHGIELSSPIKTSGKQQLTVKLHPEVSTTLKVQVTAEGGEEDAAE
ncbi:MAG: 50S ribosomal protein L9 [Akkermansiaceae bacterium]